MGVMRKAAIQVHFGAYLQQRDTYISVRLSEYQDEVSLSGKCLRPEQKLLCCEAGLQGNDIRTKCTQGSGEYSREQRYLLEKQSPPDSRQIWKETSDKRKH